MLKYIRYRKMVSELRRLPHDLLRDVNIEPWDIEKVSREAIYGK